MGVQNRLTHAPCEVCKDPGPNRLYFCGWRCPAHAPREAEVRAWAFDKARDRTARERALGMARRVRTAAGLTSGLRTETR